jgi:hypothetical protein
MESEGERHKDSFTVKTGIEADRPKGLKRQSQTQKGRRY